VEGSGAAARVARAGAARGHDGSVCYIDLYKLVCSGVSNKWRGENYLWGWTNL
jgi:hypothetical protein